MSEAIDPVCGMSVDASNPPGGSYNYEGVTYYFCAPGCREDFVEDPASYLAR
ncbi:MAG: YHS domain-containing protein [Actinomycetota bacterium]|nr:YHS domain-containing protein [Actinomycetota bacterium]